MGAHADDVVLWDLSRRHSIFDGFTDEHLGRILPYFTQRAALQGELLTEEGLQQPIVLYIILTGKFEVIKSTERGSGSDFGSTEPEQFIIATLKSGDLFGELSFVRGEAKSATIKCITSSRMLTIDRDGIKALEVSMPEAAIQIFKNLVGVVGDRLKYTSQEEVRALRLSLKNSVLNSKANLFFSYVIGLLCVYNLTLQLITKLSVSARGSSLISACIIAIFAGALALMIRQTDLPPRMFGITTKDWRPALTDSLKWTVVAVATLILLKWILVNSISAYSGLPVFDFDIGRKYLTLNLMLYALHTPIQEFVARGVLQGSLQYFSKGHNVKLRAILVSNALFAATHVHLLNGWMALMVFLPGIFWGWLYTRHENLIGVSLSHLLIGWTALFVLNAESLFGS